MTNQNITSFSEKEIVTIRVIKAGQALVFRAWAEPEHLRIWWGPRGFTNTFHEFDFRVGGRWRFVMHGPEKGNYVNECEFIHIQKPYLIEWKRHTNPLFHVSAAFEKVSEHETRVVFRQIFETAEECEKIKRYTVGKNDEVFDRLEEELLKMKGNE
ncbi:MAG: hypothetical protein FMNOHCHN_00123 [Ignavibacteriaceae bacterium]|nr:hypothetical protein [Ignavibacteriaceae bacterium]